MILANYHLDRSTPIPLYYQLKGFLLQEIQNGTYPVGSCIPTELEIQERFGLSRTTIRQAISELVQEGWLERRTSKGTFVIDSHKKQSSSNIRSFEPFYQQVKETGRTARTELLDLKIIIADEKQADWLNLSPGDKLIYLARRRYADDIPLVTLRNYLPYSRCSFILSHNFEKESLYEILSQRTETAPYLVKNIISAEEASAEDAELLHIPYGKPILSFRTISKTRDDTLIDYAFSRYHGELNKYEVEVRQD